MIATILATPTALTALPDGAADDDGQIAGTDGDFLAEVGKAEEARAESGLWVSLGQVTAALVAEVAMRPPDAVPIAQGDAVAGDVIATEGQKEPPMANAPVIPDGPDLPWLAVPDGLIDGGPELAPVRASDAPDGLRDGGRGLAPEPAVRRGVWAVPLSYAPDGLSDDGPVADPVPVVGRGAGAVQMPLAPEAVHPVAVSVFAGAQAGDWLGGLVAAPAEATPQAEAEGKASLLVARDVWAEGTGGQAPPLEAEGAAARAVEPAKGASAAVQMHRGDQPLPEPQVIAVPERVGAAMGGVFPVAQAERDGMRREGDEKSETTVLAWVAGGLAVPMVEAVPARGAFNGLPTEGLIRPEGPAMPAHGLVDAAPLRVDRADGPDGPTMAAAPPVPAATGAGQAKAIARPEGASPVVWVGAGALVPVSIADVGVGVSGLLPSVATPDAPEGPAVLPRVAASGKGAGAWVVDAQVMQTEMPTGDVAKVPLALDMVSGDMAQPVPGAVGLAPVAAGHAAPPALGLPATLPPMVAPAIVAAAQGFADDPVTLVLSPEELGAVRFEMQGKGDGVHVTLTVERPETFDLLRRHTEQLEREFRQAGFAAASFTFAGGGAGAGGQERAARPMGWLATGANPVEPARKPARKGRDAGLDMRI